MTSAKNQALRFIKGLPDDATLDDIMEGLYVIAKIERGEREIREGKGIPHEEAKRRILQKWVK